MEICEEKLAKIMTDINLLYVNSRNESSLQKKLENYQNSLVLITEAKNLIDNLHDGIANLDVSKADPSQIKNANKLIQMLNTPNLNFKELLYVTNELKKIAMGLPSEPKVNDNTEQETFIYEEQNVDA